MIWQIVKKQGLLLLRNPQQLLLLIGLPIILIAILGTALGGMLEGTAPDIHVKVGLIEHEDEGQQIDRFVLDLENGHFPVEAVEEIKANVEQMAPIHLLKETVLGNEDLKEMMEVIVVKPSEKEAIMNDDSYTALIEVPVNFTYDTLESLTLKKPSQPSLMIYKNEGSQVGFSIVENILKQFQEQLTLGAFLGKSGIDSSAIQMDEEKITGEVSTIHQKSPVSTKGYYTVGMAVMNVLFIASTIGSISFLEKKTHVFDRVILANVSRWIYFLGVFISSTIIAFLHLLIIYSFAWIVFGVNWPDLISFIIVTALFAIAVGGIGVLLSAISYRFNSESVTNFFAGIIVTIMAFLGGSFYPIGESSSMLQMVGNLTPNGAGMSAYLAILRGDGFTEISNHLFFLVSFAIAAIVIAALSFPKRGASV